MKIKNICITFSIFISGLVSAQNQNSGLTDIEIKSKTETTKLVEQLQLNSQQEEQVYEIHVNILTKNESIANSPDVTDVEKADYIRSNSEIRKELIKSLLNDIQRQKYENLLNEKNNNPSINSKSNFTPQRIEVQDSKKIKSKKE
jgi:hypothetical protein